MTNIRCIIADDEPIARQILESYIKDMPQLELVASCKNAFEVIEVLDKEDVDLLFLDINMPKLTGLSLLKTLRVQPEVIITTAYSEYAVEGFALEVTDYLLKPFSLERFIQAVGRVQKNQQEGLNDIKENKSAEKGETIFIKSDKKILQFRFEDIYYIEAYGNYLKIHTENDSILAAQTLSDFLAKLPNHFIRTHKSFIVNFNHLKLIDGNLIRLTNDDNIPIGKSYKKEVMNYIA